MVIKSIKTKHVCSIASAILVFSYLLVSGADNYSQWTYYRDIAVNTTTTGATINVNQIVFPLLVRLTPADSFVFATAQESGADIRFSKVNSGPAGVHFPYQIENWDKTNKQAAIWVLVDTVKKNNQNQSIRMFWGKNDAADSSRGTAVFNASRGFQAVWHLDENTGDTIRDVTSNKFKGIPLDTLSVHTPPSTVNGIIGFGKEFMGTVNSGGNYYRIQHSDTGKLNFDETSAYSISAWVNIDTMIVSRYFISKSSSGQYNLFSMPNGNLAFSDVQGTSRRYVKNNDSITDGQRHVWRHIAAVHKSASSSSMVLFIDGISFGNVSSGPGTRKTEYDVRIGRRPDSSSGWFDGMMDEIRFENSARDSTWIKLCYHTQKVNSIVTMGACSVMPPTSLHYPTDSLSCKTDTAIASMVPTFTGKVDSFTVIPPLPAGLIFDKINGGITGTPTDTAASFKYIVTAVNKAGSTKDTIRIAVYSPIVAPVIVSQAGNQWLRVNASTCKFWVHATGTEPLVYAWARNGAAVGTAADDTLQRDVARRTDDGAVFVCTVTNDAGSIQSRSCTLHVVAAVFEPKLSPGSDTSTVMFIDSSSGNSAAAPLLRLWSFGDGYSSDEATPKHFYSKPGSYQVKLVVSVSGVVDSATTTVTIGSRSLTADFRADTLTASGPLRVTFSNLSQGTIYKREWNFGDGKTVVDTGKDGPVEHTFAAVGSYSIKLSVCGPAGSDSLVKKDYIVVRPSNPINLTVRSLANDAVVLTWGAVTGADNIQILYSAAKPVTGEGKIADGDVSIKTVSSSAVADTLSGLKAKTRYYFGVRLSANGVCSFVTESSSGSAATLAEQSNSIIPPFIDVTGITVDSTAGGMTVRWKVDTSKSSGSPLDVGICRSTQGYRTSALAPPDSIKRNTAVLDSCILALDGDFLYDTTYFFTLFLRQGNSAWLPVSDSSKASVRTPVFSRQNVKYGKDRPLAYADNKRIRIAVKPTFPGTDTNTIARWKYPAQTGFIPVSEGFEFLVKYQSAPLDIGVKYGPIPPKRTLKNVKIYRYMNNAWFLERSALWYDSSAGYIGMTTGDINFPFIAMIDTVKPAITVITNPETPVASGSPVTDEFFISDNIANASWIFSYAKGGEAFSSENSATDVFSLPGNKINTFIPGSLVSADQGVRAILSVSDGANDSVVNVSRRVVREGGSDVVSTDIMKWVPLFVTAQLDSPRARSALKTLAGDREWAYDNTKFRLFRWFSFAGNGANKTDKYIEYTAALDSIFSFFPGRLMWIKTRQSVTIDFGKGITLDLTKPDTVTLQRQSWSDIALPFKFDITVGDVLDANASLQPYIDSLRICKWFKDGTKNYVLDELYYPPLGIERLEDKSAMFLTKESDGSGAGYSINNPSNVDIKLNIPPIPSVTSRYSGSVGKRKTAGGGGAVVIAGRIADGSVSNTVYCALPSGSTAKRYFSAAPSLGESVNLRVCDERMRQFGHMSAAAAWDKGAGITCDLAVNNQTSRPETVRITASQAGCLPQGVRLMLFNPSTQCFAEAEGDGTVRTQITVGSGTTLYCQLIAGGDDYLAIVKKSALMMKTALIGMYPNPFRQSVRIRFSVPFGFSGIVRFAVFNASGQEVWTSSVRGRRGTGDIVWTGTNKGGYFASAGVYIVQMTAQNAAGETIGVFKKTLTYLP